MQTFTAEQITAAKAAALKAIPNAVKAVTRTHNAMGIRHELAIDVLVRCPIQKRAGWCPAGYVADLI